MSLEADDRSVLFLGGNNTLYWPTQTMVVGSFRALFYLNDFVAGDISSDTVIAAGVREIMLNLDDKPTAIVEKKVSTTGATGWYTLDGRRLHDKPSVRGIYLNNGKKVFIK